MFEFKLIKSVFLLKNIFEEKKKKKLYLRFEILE